MGIMGDLYGNTAYSCAYSSVNEMMWGGDSLYAVQCLTDKKGRKLKSYTMPGMTGVSCRAVVHYGVSYA